jgi:hypothetical protein
MRIALGLPAGISDGHGAACWDLPTPWVWEAVPLLPAWKPANSMQWVLCWEDLEVTVGLAMRQVAVKWSTTGE